MFEGASAPSLKNFSLSNLEREIKRVRSENPSIGKIRGYSGGKTGFKEVPERVL
jgi:hypothetical protein